MALFLFLALIPLLGCAGGQRLADDTAAGVGMRKAVLSAGRFDLMTYARYPRPGSDLLTVYIEGDGYAFVTPTSISEDPTPKDPVALRLAARHPGNVAYLARPCQFTGGDKARGCHFIYWTTSRYAAEVVAASGKALDQLKQAAGARRLVLVGHSGGGAIAALLAAERSDVAGLVTVAGVMDHAYWTRMDDLTPLSGSLNPADRADRLASLPQFHLAGGKDKVVDPQVLQSFIRRFPAGAKPAFAVLPEEGHECCWAERWPAQLRGRLPATLEEAFR